MICSPVSMDNASFKLPYLIHAETSLPGLETNTMYQQWKEARETQRKGRSETEGEEASQTVKGSRNPPLCSDFSSTIFRDNTGLATGHYRELQARFLQQKFASLSNSIAVINETQDKEKDEKVKQDTNPNTGMPQFQITVQKPNNTGELGDGSDTANGIMSTTEQHRRRRSEGSIRLFDRQEHQHGLTRVVRTHGVISEEQTTYAANAGRLHPNSTSDEQLSSPQRLRRASVECLMPLTTGGSPRLRARKLGMLLKEKPTILDEVLEISGEQSSEDESDNFNQRLNRERRKSWQCQDRNWNDMVARAKHHQVLADSDVSPPENRDSCDRRVYTELENVESEVEGNEFSETSSVVSSLSSGSSRHSSDGTQDEATTVNKALTNSVFAPTNNIVSADEGGSMSLTLSPDKDDSEQPEEKRIAGNNHAKSATRRYSVATTNPNMIPAQKISGYSTHGALEYAKQLLGKLQGEGKTKSKKERLDELSKALKWILEELNRIEFPDRELVTLMTSLRAQIFNLRAELKMEESDENGQKIEIPLRVLSPKKLSSSRSRRFSWC